MKNRLLLALALAATAVSCHDDDVDVNQLELVYEDSVYQLTGVTVAAGKIFTNYPRWSDIHQYDVVQVNGIRSSSPYPNEAWNSWEPGQDGENKWVCAQALYRDDEGYMWAVDPASPRMQGVYEGSHKLVKIDAATNTILRTYSFDSVASPNSYLNDVQVDTERDMAYLTNSKEGGIIVLNLATGQARQVLQNHYSVMSDPAYTFKIDGKVLSRFGKPVKMHSDGIALTPHRDWLYYKPLTDDKLYRIKTEYLRDGSLSETELGRHVEDLGHFAASDGMIFDKKGNLYLSDMQHYRIVRITPQLRMQTFIKDRRLSWPDSFTISEGGYLYVTCSRIHEQPDYNDGVDKRQGRPYTIYRIRL
ncbi:major royal jelly family protein [Chitinophaga horti]|uniref:Major royal jelly family protein n=1 Tax=Chitinophaga horti TaxID=2920382 RepID=A0ABY6J5M7_9BACT|nr:major royal jelly family protein [Chitinophaga horti]UYQ94810.1 major royal jelly family protein [Chitinophaga horti]